MKPLKKSDLNKVISNQKTTMRELHYHLGAIYNSGNISLKSIKGNLWEIIVDGETKQDFAVLKSGEIAGGKSTIKFHVIKITN